MKKYYIFTLYSYLSHLPSWLWLTIIYLVTHLPALTLLPVFADEAIYIRWAQLVQEDAARYAFFSMSDGKPPLFIWLLSVTLRLSPDPLWAGRFTALIVGLLTVFVMGAIAKLLTGEKRVVIATQLFVIFVPFWWFYHRMALMDSLLTLFLALGLFFATRIVLRCQRETALAFDTIPLVLLLGVSFGAALLTKTPALFVIPVIALTPFLVLIRQKKKKRAVKEKIFEATILIGAGGVLGSILFLCLAYSPLFGALFSRGSDFTFSLDEVVAGEWRYILFRSLPRTIGWMVAYIGISLPILCFTGIFSAKKKIIGLLLFQGVIFALPLVLFGRVLYPRYFLPMAIFWTLAAAISVGELVKRGKKRALGVVLMALMFFQSFAFMVPSFVDVSLIPFVAVDRLQYLEEWSAGWGNREVYEYILSRQKDHPGRKVIVLTEGSFGTLPDGLYMYLYGKNHIEGVEIHGIGVAPKELPANYLSQVGISDVYYMVNSHRFGLVQQGNLEKIMEVKRPNHAPSLLLYQLTK